MRQHHHGDDFCNNIVIRKRHNHKMANIRKQSQGPKLKSLAALNMVDFLEVSLNQISLMSIEGTIQIIKFTIVT